MRKNNKGFTMVEMLAVVTIMGILTMVAVPRIYKYVTKTRQQSMETMFKSVYEASENYIMKENVTLTTTGSTNKTTITVDQLVNGQYLDPLIDPNGGGSNKCNGKVEVTRKNTASNIFDYSYKVTLNCSGKEESKTFN